jgi:hypothetical protein
VIIVIRIIIIISIIIITIMDICSIIFFEVISERPILILLMKNKKSFRQIDYLHTH